MAKRDMNPTRKNWMEELEKLMPYTLEIIKQRLGDERFKDFENCINQLLSQQKADILEKIEDLQKGIEHAFENCKTVRDCEVTVSNAFHYRVEELKK